MKRGTNWLGTMLIAFTAAMLLGTAPGALSNTPVKGAAFTTINPAVDDPTNINTLCLNGNGLVNCNIYTDKNWVWLTGGPGTGTAALGDGTYFFAVLVPKLQQDPNDADAGGTPIVGNLSLPDPYTDRMFTVAGGVITAYSGIHTFANNKIRLMDYADTTNPGGVYILAICSLADATSNQGTPGVNPSDCKYDAFKINAGTLETPPAHNLELTKDAAGTNTKTFAWNIQKTVDKTLVKQIGGTAIFNYTVTVTHDAGTVGNIAVAGTIKVFNPNVDSNNATVPVTIDSVVDDLSDGTICSVTNSGSQVLTTFESDFGYTCSPAALPTSELDNLATVYWSQQLLDNGALLDGGSANFTFASIGFKETKIDDCVAVTDSYAGTLGTVCSSDASPKTFTYARTVNVPQFDCVSYDNTATYTSTSTTTTGSASQTVKVCGPAKTGALTMGFWQNKNGQGIISGGASTAGVCNSGTWLRQYAPYQDLSATASCAQVATYAYNIIKAANASGSSMNAMLKAQMLATALDVYFSDAALGGNKIGAPKAIGGVAIDLTLICKMIDGSGGTATCSGTFENVSSAFGGATSLTVSQMLAYAAGQSNVGGSTWYANVKAVQQLAKDAFDAINNQVAFGA